MSGSRELFVRAKPTPGVAGSYDKHDLAVSRIVLALRGLFGPDRWLREAELRSGNLGVAFAVLSRSVERRAPDAAWSFGDTFKQLAAIEYERTLKSAKRIRGIVAHYEDRIECAFRYAFIVTDDSVIASAYESAIQTFYARVRFHIRPKSKVILLNDGWDLGTDISSTNMSRLREMVQQAVASADAAEKGSHSHEQVA